METTKGKAMDPWQEDEIDTLIDSYLDFIGYRNIPNVEESLEAWLFVFPEPLSDAAVAAIREYVADFGDTEV